MSFCNKKNRLNRYKSVSIPSNRALFERYGFSLISTSHPDNTDPYLFHEPANKQFTTAQSQMADAGRKLDALARLEEYNNAPPPSEEPIQEEPAPVGD